MLNFIDKLLDITLEIYFLSNYYEHSLEVNGEKLLWTIEDYTKNVTVCGHSSCGKWIYSEGGLIMKKVKVCHTLCICNETDVAKCSIFDTDAKLCRNCKHGADSHSKYLYSKNWKRVKTDVIQDKTIALRVSATFCTYKVQNGQPCNLEELLLKKLECRNYEQNSIYENAKTEFKNELKAMSGTINITEVIKNIKTLYDINCMITNIIPQFIKENIPKEFRLKMSRGQLDTSGRTDELGALKKDVEEIKVVVDEIKVAHDEIKVKLDEILSKLPAQDEIKVKVDEISKKLSAQEEVKVGMLNTLSALDANKGLVCSERQLKENTDMCKKRKRDTF